MKQWNVVTKFKDGSEQKLLVNGPLADEASVQKYVADTFPHLDFVSASPADAAPKNVRRGETEAE